MSTVLYTLAPTATRIRYREPYLSDALNKKYQSIVPFGIYEGFTPAPSIVAQSLDLQPGSIGHAAVVESDLDNTVQVSVHLDGTLTLDLSAQAGQTVVVLLEATYAYPQETTAYIKMYLEGDPAIPASACTICKVDVPVTAIVLTDADISLTGRTFPWDTRDRNAIPMLALAKNAGFEFVSEPSPSIGVAPPYWNLTTAGVGQFQMSNSPGPSGTGGYVIGRAVAPIGSSHTNIFYQRYSVPVSSANNRIRFGVQFQPVLQTTLNNPVLTATLINPVTGVTVQTLTIELDSSAPFLGSWTQYEETLEAYSIGADGACVAQLTLAFNNVQYGATGDAFYATDFVLEVESDSKAADVGGQLGGDTRFNTLTLTDANYATNKGVVLSHNAATDVMSLAAVPGVTGTPGLYVPGTLTIGGGVVFSGDLTVTGDLYVNGGDIQRSTSGTLSIGTTSNTTSLTLGQNLGSQTVSMIGGTIVVGFGATSTLSIGTTIANSAAITVGSTTATLTTTTVNGVTVSVGGSNTATLNLGNTSTSSATIRLGNAPTGGSVATTVQGNTVGVGTDADTTTVNVGTTTTSSAAITLGNAPAAGTVATGVAGNDISIGTSTNTSTITIGDGVSGTLRIARYLDGNTGTLSLGTDTARSTAVEVGSTSANLTLAGAAITLGTAAATTSITIGDGASGTLRVAQYLDGNTGELSLGTNTAYTTTLVTLGNNSTPLTMAGTAINLGTNAASGTMTLSRSGQTTAIAGNATVAGTSTLTGVLNADGGIGRSSAGTLTFGNDADVTAIQIGTASSTGGVSISQAGQTTTVNGALAVTQATTATGVINANGGVDRSTNAALAIGATNATDINIGRATQNVAIQNTLSITGATTATGAINANGGVDRSTAATLSLGTTNANAVTVSRTGITTTVAGALTATETATFSSTINANGGVIDRSTSGTLTIGNTTNVTGINIGTTNTTGGVTVSRSGQNTVVQGLLGVGASSPASALHVNTASPATAIYSQFTNGTTLATASDGLLVGLNSSSEAVINMQESAALRLYTAGAERLVVGSGGTVTINAPTGGTLTGLVVNSAANNAYAILATNTGAFNGYGVYGAVSGGSGTTYGGYFTSTVATNGHGVRGIASNSGYGVWGTSATATGYGGYFDNASGTALYVSGTTRMTGSLTLPATGSGADISNAVGTYGFGTWTPALSFGGASTNWTFSAFGQYVKIGRLVHVTGGIQVTGKSAGFSTGVAGITGLPFATADEAGADPFAGLYVTFVQSAAAGMTAIPTLSAASANSTVIYIYAFNGSNITDTGFQFGTVFRFSGTYISYA